MSNTNEVNSQLKDELYYLDELEGLQEYLRNGCPLEWNTSPNELKRRIYSRVFADLFTKMEREINKQPSSFFGPSTSVEGLTNCCREAIQLRCELFALFDQFRDQMGAPTVDLRDKEVDLVPSAEVLKTEF